MTKHTPTPILIKALKILSEDVKSGDGVANACIFEGAERIEALQAQVAELAEALDLMSDAAYRLNCEPFMNDDADTRLARKLYQQAKEFKVKTLAKHNKGGE